MDGQRLTHATTMLGAALSVWLVWQAAAAMWRPVTATAGAPRPVDFRIDVNTAGVGELTLLPGIGPPTARRIIDYRQTHGPFASMAELELVNMIGPVTRAKIEPWITLGVAPGDTAE